MSASDLTPRLCPQCLRHPSACICPPEWPANAPSVGEIAVAELHGRGWRDVDTLASERDFEINFAKGICIHCHEHAILDDDGWCSACDRGDPAYEAELVKRANERAAKVMRLHTAKMLRRLAEERGIDPGYREILLDEARKHEDKAS